MHILKRFLIYAMLSFHRLRVIPLIHLLYCLLLSLMSSLQILLQRFANASTVYHHDVVIRYDSPDRRPFYLRAGIKISEIEIEHRKSETQTRFFHPYPELLSNVPPLCSSWVKVCF